MFQICDDHNFLRLFWNNCSGTGVSLYTLYAITNIIINEKMNANKNKIAKFFSINIYVVMIPFMFQIEKKNYTNKIV